MLNRRHAISIGAASAATTLLGPLGPRAEAQPASRWTPIPNGKTVDLNGISYEAECGSNAVAVQRSQKGVFRFSMLPGNAWPKDDPADAERAELDGWRGHIRGDGPLWASWSMYYEPGPWSTSDWCILRQIFARYTVSSSPWSVLVLKPNGVLHWLATAQDDPKGFWPTRHNMRIEQGKWLHFVETYKFDPDKGDGYWTAWLNGNKEIDFRGKVGKTGTTTRYAKFGIYRATTTRNGQRVQETVNVRYANMRFTTQDLSHLIGKPEPIPDWEPWV
jgi:hypothetical protein